MLVVKNIPANAGNTRDMGSIPGSGRYSEIGNGNSFQYSCLKNIVDRGVWQDIVHGPTKSQIQLSTYGTHNILKHLKYANKAWEIFLKWLYEYILWIIKKSVITLYMYMILPYILITLHEKRRKGNRLNGYNLHYLTSKSAFPESFVNYSYSELRFLHLLL